jgi:hypothetical protein
VQDGDGVGGKDFLGAAGCGEPGADGVETDQSTSVPGSPFRTSPIPSRCPLKFSPGHVSRRAPQHHGEWATPVPLATTVADSSLWRAFSGERAGPGAISLVVSVSLIESSRPPHSRSGPRC